jgi:hypothetical protein
MMKAKDKAVVDRYATLELKRAVIAKELAELKPKVLALGEGLFEGDKHVLKVDFYSRPSISIPLAKAFMTAEQIAASTVISQAVRINVES